ncbi:SoxR reducing system RseC family protein [Clostridium aestuarii]|uniref:SoxR reducing system RseC family protein n=1 Tax=Clostridium aestuarii TaxID=338193 RepID=A0ABT4D102_9CLOT|nr:SoxR reducing system RseC family protein [Clostridium aestuarii]MCY6484297.1 SoxR reducing system RseC family protein [Clostridium aestuarii]
MKETGYIVSTNGEYASVVFKRGSACGENCGSCKGGCEVSAVTTQIKNTLGANVGDKVKVTLEQKVFNKMILWVYVFPLVMMVIGIGFGINVFKDAGYKNYELFSFLLGMVALAISYLILNIVSKKMRNNNDCSLRMVEVIKG